MQQLRASQNQILGKTCQVGEGRGGGEGGQQIGLTCGRLVELGKRRHGNTGESGEGGKNDGGQTGAIERARGGTLCMRFKGKGSDLWD